MKSTTTIGIDIAKGTFHLCGANAEGRVLWRKKLPRSKVLNFMANIKADVVGMEACSGAHYWGRELEKLGHQVKLMPPQYSRAYAKTNKDDWVDAEACAEAVTRPSMRFVPVKSEAHQELQHLHRVRERRIKARTGLVNQVHGMLLEFGVPLSKSVDKFTRNVTLAMEQYAERLSPKMMELLRELLEEFRLIDQEVDKSTAAICREHKANPESQRLDQILGVGTLTATAVVTCIGNPARFENGRAFSAFLGLVPKHTGTGGVIKLGGISKRGNPYVRKLLIEGAQAVLAHPRIGNNKHDTWLRQLIKRRGRNRAAVALANKNARIMWALLTKGENFDRDKAHTPLKKAA